MSVTKVKNRIEELFSLKKQRVLSVYFSAGFPELHDTLKIAQWLQESGADMIEIGMPFSDPIADGPTIQESNKKALDNGMSIKLLFDQLSNLRQHVEIPVILMGYLNPVIQFGIERFCSKCEETGVDGLILPDLPMAEYLEEYRNLFEQHGLFNIFLITPQTSEDRIRQIDRHSNGFIYMVSSASVTGARNTISGEQTSYFDRINAMALNHPALIGFGISNKETFDLACRYATGAIIGSAFIKTLASSSNLEKDIKSYIASVKE